MAVAVMIMVTAKVVEIVMVIAAVVVMGGGT